MALTEAQASRIRAVKHKIVTNIHAMQNSAWAEPYILPWDKMILTGGAIASLLQGESPKDWDFYFTDELSMTKMRDHLVLTQTQYIKDVDPAYQESVGVNGKLITANAITMKTGASFITMMYGTPKVIKSTFDFVHCTPHYSLADGKLYISESQYDCCVNKKLVVNNASAVKQKRIDKFVARGYNDSTITTRSV